MDAMTAEPRSRWERLAGRLTGDAYADHFVQLAASGQDVHGEATFCAGLLPAPARVLDAGCGTGRVAIRLAELGYDTVGVDVDLQMLEVARKHAPDLVWVAGDLASVESIISELKSGSGAAGGAAPNAGGSSSRDASGARQVPASVHQK